MTSHHHSVVGFLGSADPKGMERVARNRRTPGLRWIVATVAAADLLLLSLIWPYSTLSGRVSDPDRGAEIVAKAIDPKTLPEPCLGLLVDFASDRVRMEIAAAFPTWRLFKDRADMSMRKYTTKGCPTGALLATRVAAEDVVRFRQSAEAAQKSAIWGRP